MTSDSAEVQCLGKRASDASICSDDVKMEDLPLHQAPEEAYVDFGGRFTRTPEGRPLVVLRAELLTDREGRVSSAAASECKVLSSCCCRCTHSVAHSTHNADCGMSH